jgi:hypothetical protein
MTRKIRINGRELSLPPGAVLVNGIVIDTRTGEEIPASLLEITTRSPLPVDFTPHPLTQGVSLEMGGVR